jgi:hypothetical protein
VAEARGDGDEGALPVDRSLLDPSSGLFAQPFFLATVTARLRVCRRALRPLAVAIFEVVDGLPDGPVVPADPRMVAAMAASTLRAADVAARMADGTYGLLLEDTPPDGAVWTVERLRRSLGPKPRRRSLRAGIACYPGQALTATDMMAAARAALAEAREWPQDRIEVAPAPG